MLTIAAVVKGPRYVLLMQFVLVAYNCFFQIMVATPFIGYATGLADNGLPPPQDQLPAPTRQE